MRNVIIADKSGNKIKMKHGLSKHPIYRVWIKIKDRLYNPNHEAYSNYGGKGVTMCNEWLHNPVAFIDWALNNGWDSGKHIDKDKIPFEKGIPALIYSPEMCSILTPKENNKYTKYNTWIEFKGKKMPLSDWAIELKIDDATLHHRLFDFGYSIEEAFTLPPGIKRNKKLHEYNGEYKSLHEWGRRFNMNRGNYIS